MTHFLFAFCFAFARIFLKLDCNMIQCIMTWDTRTRHTQRRVIIRIHWDCRARSRSKTSWMQKKTLSKIKCWREYSQKVKRASALGLWLLFHPPLKYFRRHAITREMKYIWIVGYFLKGQVAQRWATASCNCTTGSILGGGKGSIPFLTLFYFKWLIFFGWRQRSQEVREAGTHVWQWHQRFSPWPHVRLFPNAFATSASVHLPLTSN
jgi:hypothetical protein